ncbi:MAG: SDR family NAD(P)-dependent oxidoreductase [Alphaproteobacteria bacterium]
MTIGAGRKAFITGGASGFGLAIARRLADAGASVAITDVAQAKLTEATGRDPRLLGMVCDVTDKKAVTEAVKRTIERFGGLDTLICCAGVVHVKPLGEVSEAEWDLTLDVNLKGVFLAAQAAEAALRASKRGRIVAIASDAGKRGYPMWHAYCASKFGVLGLCQSLAAELAPDRVTVNCVCPAGCPTTGMGQTLTQWKMRLTGRSESDVLGAMARSFPLGRYVEEEDVVSAIAYFVSDEAGFITGTSIDIDGGESLGGAYQGAAEHASQA